MHLVLEYAIISAEGDCRLISSGESNKAVLSGSDLRKCASVLAVSALLIGADSRIERANNRADALFGWDDTGVIGQSFEVLLPPTITGAHNERNRVG